MTDIPQDHTPRKADWPQSERVGFVRFGGPRIDWVLVLALVLIVGAIVAHYVG